MCFTDSHGLYHSVHDIGTLYTLQRFSAATQTFDSNIYLLIMSKLHLCLSRSMLKLGKTFLPLVTVEK